MSFEDSGTKTSKVVACRQSGSALRGRKRCAAVEVVIKVGGIPDKSVLPLPVVKMITGISEELVND